jgi:hypothetical protein
MAAAAPIRERRETLLGDPRVKRWHKDHRQESTAEVQLAQLELFLRRANLDIDRLLEIARAQRARKSRKFEDVVHAWIEKERKEGRPDSYLATNWYAVRSFLRHEESAPEWSPKLKVRFGTTIANEVVPTPEQLRAVLDRTPVPRIRALILLLATSGIRIGVLGARFTVNGLRLRHLPELDLEGMKFRRAPFKVEVPAELSKGGSPYFTFASVETATEYLTYLEARRDRGERLGPNSPAFAPEPKAPNVHRRVAADGAAFLTEKGLADEIRRAFARAVPKGTRWRPYVLRSFASSQLMLAENAGMITRDAREFVLGHSASIGRRYNLAKGRVRVDLEEEVRGMYERASERFLRIVTLSELPPDYRPILRVLLGSAGYSKAEIDGMGELTEEGVIQMIRDKRESSADVPTPKPGDNARTVAVSELDSFLSKGWRPIAPAGPDRFVVGAPN